MNLSIGTCVTMKKDFEGNGAGLSGVIDSIGQSPDGRYQRYHIVFNDRHAWAKDPDHRGWWIYCEDPNDYFILSDGQEISVNGSRGDKRRKQVVYEAGMSIQEYIEKLVEDNNVDKDRLKWLKTFQRCVLPVNVREVIEEALTVVLNKKKFDEWGINSHFEKGLTNSILIYGPPGTGKTMVSESIAAVLGKNLMKIDNAILQSQIPGQVERNIKSSFEQAKNGNCVLMFDECDSMLSSREMVGVILGSEINVLLTEIERFDGVILLTTNRINRLDSALARRIVAKIKLDLPDKETRKEIWQKLLPPNLPLCELIDWDKLADTKIAGGDIKNAIILAARKAIAKNETKVTMDHFVSALKIANNSEFIDHEKPMRNSGHRDSFVEKVRAQGDKQCA